MISNSDVPEIPGGQSLLVNLVGTPDLSSRFQDAMNRHLFNLDGCIHVFVYEDGKLSRSDPELRQVAQRSGQPTVLVFNPYKADRDSPIPRSVVTNGAETAIASLHECRNSIDVKEVVQCIGRLALRLPHVIEPLSIQEVGIGARLQEWSRQCLRERRTPMVTISAAETFLRTCPEGRFVDVQRCLARLSAAGYVQTHPMSDMVLLDVCWVFRSLYLISHVRGGLLYCDNFDTLFASRACANERLEPQETAGMCEWLVRCKIAVPLVGAKRSGFMVFPALLPCNDERCFCSRASFVSNLVPDADFIKDGYVEEALVFEGVQSPLLLWEVVHALVMSHSTEDALLSASPLCFLLRVKSTTIRLALNPIRAGLLAVVSGPAPHGVLLRIQDLIDDVLERDPTWVEHPARCVHLGCPTCGVLTDFYGLKFRALCDHGSNLLPCVKGLKGQMCGRWSPMRSAWIGAVVRFERL